MPGAFHFFISSFYRNYLFPFSSKYSRSVSKLADMFFPVWTFYELLQRIHQVINNSIPACIICINGGVSFEILQHVLHINLLPVFFYLMLELILCQKTAEHSEEQH